MKTFLILGAMAVLVAGCATPPMLDEAEISAQTRSLFDGETLDGWQVTGDANWSVVDGVIEAGSGGDGFLVSEREYLNFHLILEFWVDEDTNSGVFVRCSNSEVIHASTCYEANIWDNHPQQEARSGAIVFKAMPPLNHVDTVGRWNTYKIAADGQRMLIQLNGVDTAFLTTAERRAGVIALQRWRDGTVRFRNITIREL